MPGERTEQATARRQEKAKEQGDILHSRELTSAAGTLAGVIVLGALGGRTLEQFRIGFSEFLALGAPAHWEQDQIGPTLLALRRVTLSMLGSSGVVMAAVAMAALGVAMVQTGGVNVHME